MPVAGSATTPVEAVLHIRRTHTRRRPVVIVLDTNVVSEVMKARPSLSVSDWVRRQPGGEIVTTTLTLAEILDGVARLPAGRRQLLLRTDAATMFSALPVVDFDSGAATLYADVVLSRDRRGSPISSIDAQIAAICRACSAQLATRNTRDFVHTEVDLCDPWAVG